MSPLFRNRAREAAEAALKSCDTTLAILESGDVDLGPADRLRERTLQSRNEDVGARVAAMDRIRANVENKLTLESAKQRDDLFRLQEDLARRERALAEREAIAGTAAPVPGPATGSQEFARIREALEAEFAQRLRDVEEREARIVATEGDATRIAKEAEVRLSSVAAEEARLKEVEARLQGYRDEIQSARQALMTVDEMLTKMPYEVIENFTRTEDFEAYEKAFKSVVKGYQE